MQMNRRELLHELNNAITFFEKREALCSEYERVQQKDRPYEEKRKIGWLGIIVLGVEIYYVAQILLVFVVGLFLEPMDGMMEMLLFSMIGVAIVLTTYWLFRMHNIKRNKRVDKENLKIKELKLAIEKRKKEIKQEYDVLQDTIDRYVGTWYPEGYEKSYIASYFYQVLENGRARTLGEAINLYEEECFRRRQQEENEQILEGLKRQNFKQNVQIAQSAAEAAALSAQLASANKQLASTNKQLAEMKKELAELKKDNTRRR